MAWKEFSELKSEDQQYELAKQRMIVGQSSLKVAADLVIAADREKNDIATLSSATRTIAGALTDWVYEKANEKDDKPTVLPTPTAAQKKVLDAIQDKTGIEWGAMCKQVLDIAEEDYNIRKFPENMSSVAAFVSKLK